ncbi:hypothetical protein EW146_g2874 [Bondarzewia mesenterica]|uniref:Uncharacterized protein n=1 Tax=Bondarzewia mesenterica TaxID=1095465 RepID=A0A4S4LZD2_9AGAM|nr:hypothetical protein EW146_g2874 [Bondarzewia mesenterica]
MPAYDDADGSSSSFFLSPPSPSPRKSPARQSLSLSRNRSTTSLRGSSSNLAQSIAGMEDDGASGRHSLAHELAVALLPEPSAGSKLLAEEFGIEYDEGAEGIDGEVGEPSVAEPVEIEQSLSFADEATLDLHLQQQPPSPTARSPVEDIDFVFGSPVRPTRQRRPPEQDAMVILSQDLESTEKFLSHLRRLDADSAPSSSGLGFSSQPALEKIASDIIRKIEETARDREGQVRELLEYEREFRKMAGEVGGSDALAGLDALEGVEDLMDPPSSASAGTVPNGDTAKTENRRTLDSVAEESIAASIDWEVDPDQHMREDEDDGYDSEIVSPIKDSFSLPPPPPIHGPLTPAKTIPQLAHLRSYTTSLVSSLTVISEHAQVNGAATTEAGRKIRALKNKLGGWRTDWDSAERSRVKIERWEAGMTDADGSPSTPTKSTRKRVDGRKIVEEHLRAFELALNEANVKTQAIMAPS